MKIFKSFSKILFTFGLIFLCLAAFSAFLGHEGLTLRLINGVYFVFVLGTAAYIGELIGEKD